VIAHREELLTQAKDKIARCGIPENKIDIVLQSHPDPNALVWVASIQTIIRGNRLKQIKPSLIVIDEAHHSVAKSYRDVIDSFPGIPVIGFTATPTRTSPKEKQELAKIWGEIVYQYPLKKAIIDEHLATIDYYEVKTDINLDDVQTVAGDFQQDELAKKVNVYRRNLACVEKYQELGGGKAIVFCVDVEHALNMQSVFQDHGIACDCLVGETQSDTRQSMIQSFQETPMTQNKVLTNCMVLTEGFDCPDVRMIVMARPTQSPIVYLQQIGRGTRKAPGKESVIIVDIADNCKKKKLQNCLTTVFNLNPNMKIEGNVLAAIAKKEAEKKEEQENDIEQESLEIQKSKILFAMPMELEYTSLAWYSPKDGEYYCAVASDRYWHIKDNGLDYTLSYISKEGKKKIFGQGKDLLVLSETAWKFSKRWHENTRFMWDKTQRACWSNQAPTDKQIEIIAKVFPDIDTSKIDKGTATSIISAYFTKQQIEPATQRQIYFLRKHGIEWQGSLSKKQAGRLIAEYKAKIGEAQHV
jgi:superfamily II DNA or RNA helicase